MPALIFDAQLLNVKGVRARRADQHLTALHDANQEAFGWYINLCGHPHKSAYADSRVMPRGSRDRLPSAGAELERSA